MEPSPELGNGAWLKKREEDSVIESINACRRCRELLLYPVSPTCAVGPKSNDISSAIHSIGESRLNLFLPKTPGTDVLHVEPDVEVCALDAEVADAASLVHGRRGGRMQRPPDPTAGRYLARVQMLRCRSRIPACQNAEHSLARKLPRTTCPRLRLEGKSGLRSRAWSSISGVLTSSCGSPE